MVGEKLLGVGSIEAGRWRGLSCTVMVCASSSEEDWRWSSVGRLSSYMVVHGSAGLVDFDDAE